MLPDIATQFEYVVVSCVYCKCILVRFQDAETMCSRDSIVISHAQKNEMPILTVIYNIPKHALTSFDAISSFAKSIGDAMAMVVVLLLTMDGADRRVNATADPVSSTVAPSIA